MLIARAIRRPWQQQVAPDELRSARRGRAHHRRGEISRAISEELAGGDHQRSIRVDSLAIVDSMEDPCYLERTNHEQARGVAGTHTHTRNLGGRGAGSSRPACTQSRRYAGEPALAEAKKAAAREGSPCGTPPRSSCTALQYCSVASHHRPAAGGKEEMGASLTEAPT